MTGVNVLLVADPGLPTARARSIEDELQQLLDEAFSPPITLDVQTAMLRRRPDDSLDLSDAIDLAREYSSPDAVLLLTEIPRLNGGHPLIAEISGPTLGRHRPLNAPRTEYPAAPARSSAWSLGTNP